MYSTICRSLYTICPLYALIISTIWNSDTTFFTYPLLSICHYFSHCRNCDSGTSPTHPLVQVHYFFCFFFVFLKAPLREDIGEHWLVYVFLLIVIINLIDIRVQNLKHFETKSRSPIWLTNCRSFYSLIYYYIVLLKHLVP